MLHICNISNFDSEFENFPFAGQIELPLVQRRGAIRGGNYSVEAVLGAAAQQGRYVSSGLAHASVYRCTVEGGCENCYENIELNEIAVKSARKPVIHL